MPYQMKLLPAEQWTLSRIAWTNTGQKMPQMSELTGSNHRCRAHFKCAQSSASVFFSGTQWSVQLLLLVTHYTEIQHIAEIKKLHMMSSSSRRSAVALVLLARQHSHIAPEVTYIHISNIYILAFWHRRWVSYSRTTGLLVREYFYFCTEYSYVHV